MLGGEVFCNGCDCNGGGESCEGVGVGAKDITSWLWNGSKNMKIVNEIKIVMIYI